MNFNVWGAQGSPYILKKRGCTFCGCNLSLFDDRAEYLLVSYECEASESGDLQTPFQKITPFQSIFKKSRT